MIPLILSRERERRDEKVASNSRKLLPNCKVENEREMGNCRGSIRGRRVIQRSTRSRNSLLRPRSLHFLANFVVGLDEGAITVLAKRSCVTYKLRLHKTQDKI